MKAHSISLSIVFIFLFSTIHAQVVISEYSASNMNEFEDNFNKYEDFIELHNTGTTTIDISGYGLSDKETKPQKWLFPNGTVLDPDEYLIVWCSGRNESFNGNYHSNFKISQTKGNEYILLSDASGAIIESSLYELTLLSHSRVKQADGSWWIARNGTPGQANPTTNIFKRYTTTPNIVQQAGFYEDSILVEITTEETDGTLRYSLDGNIPTQFSSQYSLPLRVAETTVVKARFFPSDPEVLPGKIDYATYLINEEFTMPVFSIAADGMQDLANGNGGLRPIGSIEYFVDGQLSSHSYGELNRHGQDSWVNDQRSLDWVSRDEMGYSKTLEEQLFSYSDRNDYQRFMLRASGDDNYPSINDGNHEGNVHLRDEYVHTLAYEGNMKLDIRAVERCIVFLNGDYWGIYSPRERPVDHDYTEYYYNQGKFDLQYILTWGSTWAEYGGQKSFDDWVEFRDFIMENDMGDPENYQRVKDNMQVLSLIDYMIVNLNSVCSDWINYNTGVWRGLNPDGDHKKWGYILWDNDATFDYYINYSGVPNTNPDAEPCDIEDISDFMDQFWPGSNNGNGEVDSTFAANCETVLNGSSPYPPEDPIFQAVIENDIFCCDTDWDNQCQFAYNALEENGTGVDTIMCASIDNGSSPYPGYDPIFQQVVNFSPTCCDDTWTNDCQTVYNFINNGGFGDGEEVEVNTNLTKHEKIFLKLQDESPEFRQLYYSRQADMMNTAWSCENMNATLERMIEELNPEMPRHIQRWEVGGGSWEEWNDNLDRLRNFINARCEALDDGMVNCFELEGPFDLTLEVFPQGAGDIDLNTIEVTDFPWTGAYFGGMENLIDADPGADYDFVRWESKSGTAIFPDANSENASVVLTQADTLIAIFELETSVKDVIDGSDIKLEVFPSPTNNIVNISYTLESSGMVQLSIYDVLGQKVKEFPATYRTGKENHKQSISLKEGQNPTGTYIIRIDTEQGTANRKVIFVE